MKISNCEFYVEWLFKVYYLILSENTDGGLAFNNLLQFKLDFGHTYFCRKIRQDAWRKQKHHWLGSYALWGDPDWTADQDTQWSHQVHKCCFFSTIAWFVLLCQENITWWTDWLLCVAGLEVDPGCISAIASKLLQKMSWYYFSQQLVLSTKHMA